MGKLDRIERRIVAGINWATMSGDRVLELSRQGIAVDWDLVTNEALEAICNGMDPVVRRAIESMTDGEIEAIDDGTLTLEDAIKQKMEAHNDHN